MGVANGVGEETAGAGEYGKHRVCIKNFRGRDIKVRADVADVQVFSVPIYVKERIMAQRTAAVCLLIDPEIMPTARAHAKPMIPPTMNGISEPHLPHRPPARREAISKPSP